MRLCILVMARTNNHDVAPEKEAGRWRLGEIVDIYDADKQGMDGPDGELAFNRIYVPDWKGTLDEAKEEFTKSHPLARREAVVGDVFGKERFIELTVDAIAPALSTRAAEDREQVVAFESVKLEEIIARPVDWVPVELEPVGELETDKRLVMG